MVSAYLLMRWAMRLLIAAVVGDVGKRPRGAVEASKMCWWTNGTPASRMKANTFSP